MNERFHCAIEVICPIHIGCGEVYDPTSFVVDEKKNQIITFNPLSFVAGLSPQEKTKLSQICSKGTISSLLDVYRFFRGRKAEGKTIDLANGFLKHYGRTLDLRREDDIQNELNRFVIFRTSFHAVDARPYIPGSAFKGAIRTAYLNSLAKGRSGDGREQARELEKALLGGAFENDPFRFVKVSDFMPVGHVNSRILYAVNEKKKPSNFPARGPFQILETIEPGSQFRGTIDVETPHPNAGIGSPISLHGLLDAMDDFFEGEMKRETGELRSIGARPVDGGSLQGHLVRLGRHSGAELLTIEGFRNIKIMKGRGERAASGRNATTLWLASETSKPKTKEFLRPFGWAGLRPITEGDLTQFETLESEWQDRLHAAHLTIDTQLPAEERPVEPLKPSNVQRETWVDATLTFRPQDGTLVATHTANRRAETKDKLLIPESMRRQIIDKRKSKKVTVEVERYGNAFRIIGIK